MSQKKVTTKKKFTGLSSTEKRNAVALDAFRNLAARMGHNTPSLSEGAEYELVRWTNNYWLMLTLYRNHWISRRIVEKPAQDMCKAWPKLKCSLEPKDIESFDRTLRRTMTAARIQKTIKWSRLFGGAGALIAIDGQENKLDEPLDLDSIEPGSYRGLIPFDRWSGIAPGGEMASDINDPITFNTPEFYIANSTNKTGMRIHASRILRFSGPEVPTPEYEASMYWGISELEICFEELRKRDNASWSILQLLFRAQILTQVNPQLAQMLSGATASMKAQQQFAAIIDAQNQLMSNNSMLVLPEEGKLESHQYTFGGVAEVYQQFQMDIAGAARIPVSILFGRTVSGLSQSNDADIRIYEQEIAQKQNEDLRPQLDKLYPIICMSEFGEIPDDLDIEFPSVRVLTEEEKSELAQKGGAAINEAFTAGIITQQVAGKEYKQLSDKTEIFTNLSDEDIEKMDNNFQLALETDLEQAGSGGEETGNKSPKAKANDSLPTVESEELKNPVGLLDWISNKINVWKASRD